MGWSQRLRYKLTHYRESTKLACPTGKARNCRSARKATTFLITPILIRARWVMFRISISGALSAWWVRQPRIFGLLPVAMRLRGPPDRVQIQFQ